MIPLLFRIRKVPKEVPKGLQKEIDKLKKLKTKRQVLEAAFKFVTNRYYGHRSKTFTQFFDLWKWTIPEIWKRKGFLHCTTINYILRTMLIKSGKFKDSDIKHKLTFVYYWSIHQYLYVRLGKNDWIEVDPWGYTYGVDLGDHAYGFHKCSMKRLR